MVQNSQRSRRRTPKATYPPAQSRFYEFTRVVAAEVNNQCSFPEPINSGVLQGSVQYTTLFIHWGWSLKNKLLIHAYADDSSMKLYSTSFNRRLSLSQQELHFPSLVAAEWSTANFTMGQKNLLPFITSKSLFLLLSTYIIFRTPILYLSLDNIQLSTFIINILCLSLIKISLSNSASSRLDVLYCLSQFISLY